MKKITRRRFLKGSLLMTGAAMATALTGCSSSTSSSVSPEEEEDQEEQNTAGWWDDYGDLEHLPDVANMEPIQLAMSASEVGTTVYVTTNNYASAILNYLPEGSKVDVSTDMLGTGTSPFLISNGTCDVCMGDSAPTKWAVSGITPNMEGTVAENVYTIGGATSFSCVVCILGEAFVKKTGYTSLEKALEDHYPLRLVSKAVGTLGDLLMARREGCFGEKGFAFCADLT